ncbi:hypothetical protein NKR23_g7850 [Pleurostoma richardsiae]|uniref:Uncharacterized protein n=1 Tax=Pleurostoma richardsiae TaxID=41990 RepID=A0AA38RGS7_9PEZI|nr:hypothetical protein NKR23_g7850 [Pleurostoma richardsiae]
MSENVESMRAFYDYFMKDVNNDWLFTPPVPMSILNLGGRDIVNRPETEYPLAQAKPFQLFLDAKTMSLQSTPAEQSRCNYDAVSGSVVYDAQGRLQRSTVIDVGWLADDPDVERKTLLAKNEQDKKFCAPISVQARQDVFECLIELWIRKNPHSSSPSIRMIKNGCFSQVNKWRLI